MPRDAGMGAAMFLHRAGRRLGRKASLDLGRVRICSSLVCGGPSFNSDAKVESDGGFQPLMLQGLEALLSSRRYVRAEARTSEDRAEHFGTRTPPSFRALSSSREGK